SFAGGAVAATGEVGQVAGRVMAKLGWGTGANLLARRLSFGRWQSLAALTEGVGKLLGAVGGVIIGVAQFYEGAQAFTQGDAVFGIGTMVLGISAAGVTVAIALSWITLGTGVAIVLVLVAAGYLIGFFRHDELQKWLDACYFGKHGLTGDGYRTHSEQEIAYDALLAGN